MKIADAREKIVEKLKAKGLLVSIDENYVNRIATAERTGGTIEPQIMLQWFVDVNKKIPARGDKSLKELMLEPVREEKRKRSLLWHRNTKRHRLDSRRGHPRYLVFFRTLDFFNTWLARENKRFGNLSPYFCSRNRSRYSFLLDRADDTHVS